MRTWLAHPCLALGALAALAPRATSQCDVWSALGAGTGRVQALASYDDGSGPALYVCGGFTSAGGVPAENVARWDGSAWSPLGAGLTGGLNSWVWSLAVYDDGTGPALYAGGTFTSAGGTPASNVARWDGTSWSALGAGVAGPFGTLVRALRVFDDGTGPALYAGGTFTSAGGTPVASIARWNGLGWSPVGAGIAGGVLDLEVFDDGGGPALHAGGAGLSKWDGTSWTALPGVTGVPFQVGVGGLEALEVFDDGTGPALYGAGAFTAAGGTPVSNIARWDGASWSALGSGVRGLGIASQNPPNVIALQAFGSSLYAGGWFTQAGGAPVSGIAAWDGATWSDVGGGVNAGLINGVFGLAVHDDGSGPALFAGGLFVSMSNVAASCVAKWQRRASPATYCTAGSTAIGCSGTLSAVGAASASTPSGFQVRAAGLEGGRKGALMFGTAGPSATPWGSSFLCAQPPLRGTGVQSSGGARGQCDGSLQLDFNAWMASHPAAAPAVGRQVWMQAWFRDPAATPSTGLSDGLTFFVCP